ncbi:hypothetical protein ACROYT_G044079 [Oculina patagonica]
MSSGEKLAKGKSKKAVPKAKSAKGKEVPLNDQRFRGDGVKFKCKLVGTADVNSARGDAMCAEAIKKLKVQALKLNKESGEHKQRIVLYVTLKGIRIVDEKTQKVQHEHPINKISFITHDPEDKKIFGYVCSQPCTTGHKMFAVKSEKPAGVVTGTLYELFQVVFQLRQQAGLAKKVPNSAAQVSNGPSPQESDGIYEVPYKNGNNKQANATPQLDHEYAEPVKKDPHYKVPKNQPIQAALPPIPGENNKAEVGEKTASADVLNSSTLLSQSSMDKDPDQVSQASVEVPFTPQDGSSADMAFFSPSVFDSAPGESGAADTTSVASADISVLRSGSVSSGSSESHSQDARSVHSRSSSVVNQPVAAEGFPAEFATAFDDKSELGPSSDSKAKQEEEQALESGNQGDTTTVPPPLDGANTKDNFNAPTLMETSAVFESNPDPFASSEISNERTQPVAGENFFSESFAAFDTSFSDLEVKNDKDDTMKDDTSANDPFASSGGAQEKVNAFESAEGFVSETSFETAFGSEQFTPTQDSSTVVNNQAKEDTVDDSLQKSNENSAVSFSWDNAFEETTPATQPDTAQSTTTSEVQFSWTGEEKSVDDGLQKSDENSAVSFSWDNAFGETKSTTQPETTQSASASEVQFSWTESFASEDVEPSVKTGPDASGAVSWDDAFGGAVMTDNKSSNQALDAFSWDDAFGGMAADSGNQKLDSSPFEDPFAPSSTVESCSDVPSTSEHSEQPVSQSIVPNNPQVSVTPNVPEADLKPVSQSTAADNHQLFDDGAFTTPSSLQFQDGTTDVAGTEESNNPPVLSKDPFEEFAISFPAPASNPEKIDAEETQENAESENSNGNKDNLFAMENTLSELPPGENSKEAKGVKEMDEILTQTEEQSPDEDDVVKTETDEMPEVQPSELLIEESTSSFSERPVSPTAPPPLPPRPAMSAPPLPARPSSSSSTVSTGMSPISPQTSTGSPGSNSPRHGKKGSAKKPPPALPPRVDLNEKPANNSSNKKEAFPDPFGLDFFDQRFDESKGVSKGGNSDWAASWPSSQKTTEEKSKDLSDPFSEDFFTNFDFPQKSEGSTTKSDNLDPFATTNPPSELFPSTFGNQDLFAAFTPAKGDGAFDGGDPFRNDLSDSFAAFSSDDPFSDISDPFADKGVLSDDPFGDSPKKPQSGKALTLNESLVASDEADSFA